MTDLLGADRAAFLAVDLGSSGVRVMLGMLQPALDVAEMLRVPTPVTNGADGRGWDLAAIWAAVQDGLAAGMTEADRRGVAVEGIGVTSWGVDYARLTADGDLRPFVRHHRDMTGAASPPPSEPDAAGAYAATGVLDQPINTVHQLRRDAADGRGAPDDVVLLVADAVVHLLTGAVAAEASLASTTALVDRRTGDWSSARTADLPARFPRIVPAGASAGVTRPEVAARIGARDPLPVWHVTAHDTAAAFSAVTGAADDRADLVAVVSCGSWSVVGAALPAPLLTDAARRAGLTQEVGADGDILLAANLSGMWLLQEVIREWGASDEQLGAPPTTLDQLLRDAAVSPYRGVFDPADPSLQAPGGLPDRIVAAAVASSGERPRSRGDVVRTIFESLAASYARTVAHLEHLTGRRVAEVRIVGGGSRIALLGELTAERTGLPVLRGPVEASVIGVLLQLAVASGRAVDLAAARRALVPEPGAAASVRLEGVAP
ncbi:FGGY-family carbohydrate kinase [Microbacterium sp. 1P10UB]|uniref:rhamnulokinase n=1 Tax=unclassified Microbacterium TaxID=2609290 RepID=UPI0039A2BDC8